MRIAHTVVAFPPAVEFGGPAVTAFELGRLLAARGAAVTVVATNLMNRTERVPARRATIAGIDVSYCRALWLGSYGASISVEAIREIRSAVSASHVVHVHGYRNWLAALAARHARNLDIPYIVHPHGTIPAVESRVGLKHVFDFAIGRRMLGDAAAVVATTEAERTSLVKAGVHSSKVRTIPCGIVPDDFQQLPDRGEFRRAHGIPDDQALVAYLGRIHARKGVDTLIRAFAASRRRSRAMLAIAGPDAGHARVVRRLARALNIEGSVIFPGMLRAQSKYRLLVDADVVVYPGRFEAFGLVPLEAVMCGTPVIVAGDWGCGEVAREIGGYVVPPDDWHAMAAMIDHVLAARADAGERVRAGREVIRAKYDWAIVATRFHNLYREVSRS
jgi:glycosyltransferase involved in cell wall biosynthesis